MQCNFSILKSVEWCQFLFELNCVDIFFDEIIVTINIYGIMMALTASIMANWIVAVRGPVTETSDKFPVINFP